MENEMLMLKDFNLGKTDVNPNEIAGFNSESQYMALCVELAKEAFKITSILAASYRLDSNNKPRKWTRNEAIIGGLFVRLAKLQMAMLDSVCQKRQELASILAFPLERLRRIGRMLGEGVITAVLKRSVSRMRTVHYLVAQVMQFMETGKIYCGSI